MLKILELIWGAAKSLEGHKQLSAMISFMCCKDCFIFITLGAP